MRIPSSLLLLLCCLQLASCDAIVSPGAARGAGLLASASASVAARRLQQNKQRRQPSMADDGEGVTILSADKKAAKAPAAASISLSPLDLFLCGLIATALGDFIMHPIDTIKVTQQGATVASSILKTARTIYKDGGILGFYPGVIPYCTADGLSGAIKFAAFELSKIFVEARVPLQYHPLTQFICAAGAMLACSIVLVPGEVIKTRLQTGMVTSVVQCITQTVKQEGITGLFAGYYATMLRDVPYTMLELGLYENIKTLIRKVQKRSDLTQQEELAAAAFTGGFTGFVTTPLDLIKTKLMMQSAGTGQYKGVFDALSSIYKAGGVKALFVGSSARVAWLLPFTTIYLGIYEIAKRQVVVWKKASIAEKKRLTK